MKQKIIFFAILSLFIIGRGEGFSQPNQKDKGKLYLEEKEWDSAYLIYKEILQEFPCNQEALNGFKIIGGAWRQDPDRSQESVQIYEILNRCSPNNADTLYFYGRALYQTSQFDQAKEILNQCLSLAPNYSDAQILLGYIALQENQLDTAEKIFSAFPGNSDAVSGAKLVKSRRDQADSQDRIRRARQAHFDLDYDQAEMEYSWLIEDDSNRNNHWPALFDVKSHTKPSLVVETNYTDAKEDDPSVNAPVVKDYYFLNNVHLRIPIYNCWRLDLKQLYYHQRENDIYPPIGVNYSAYSNGGEVISRVYFAHYWRWDLSFRAFRMWGDQTGVNFPFHDTTRFEPGTTLFYNDGSHLFVLNSHRESYIIKNFTTIRSELLATDYISARYGFRLKEYKTFELEVAVDHIFIHDSLNNWKNSEEGIARIGVPFSVLSDYFTILYRFEHGHFDKLNLNYFSFKQQLRNTLGIKFQYDFTKSTSWDVVYEHRWQTTYNLFQPIGIFILVEPKQYLVGNRIASKISTQYKDKLRLELEGHYFYETLPYRDWNLKGSLVWQF